ncbi:MAG TPA: histidine kinase, partial [Cryptosporangiaceae bacterium]|nr:histidine kinase [Cryptosporangiaceae bacterium]
MPGVAATAADQAHFWERTAPVWHVVFGGGVLASAIAILAEEPTGSGDRTVALVALAAMCAWYAATGARTLHGASERLGHLYLLGAIPLFAVMMLAHGSAGYVLFVLIPQVYIFVDRLRYAALTVLGLFAILATTVLLRVPELRAQPWGFLFGLGVSAAMSALIGLWIGGIIRQSISRSKLIAELRETQAALAAEREAAGALTERARLAAEIHDTLAQGFTSILMLTQAAEAVVDRDPDAVREQLALIEHTARENLTEARSMVAALTPVPLQDATLPEAVRRLATRHTDQTGVAVGVRVVGEPITDPDHDVVLL